MQIQFQGAQLNNVFKLTATSSEERDQNEEQMAEISRQAEREADRFRAQGTPAYAFQTLMPGNFSVASVTTTGDDATAMSALETLHSAYGRSFQVGLPKRRVFELKWQAQINPLLFQLKEVLESRALELAQQYPNHP